MGALHAAEFAEHVEDGAVSFDAAIRWHLGSNHFPPINPVFDDAAKTAIENVNVGDYDIEIELPNGRILTSGEIVEQLHLEPFLDRDEVYW